ARQQQSALEDYAPERLVLPNSRTVKVVYAVDGPPTIAARIQDLYGIKEALWVASRRVPVRIQVLAPNNRPVQITDNLSVFWRETYPKLKQERQRRYRRLVGGCAILVWYARSCGERLTDAIEFRANRR